MALEHVWVLSTAGAWVRGDQLVRVRLTDGGPGNATPNTHSIYLTADLRTIDGGREEFGPGRATLANKISYSESQELAEQLIATLVAASGHEGGGRISVDQGKDGAWAVRFKPFVDHMADPWQSSAPTNSDR